MAKVVFIGAGSVIFTKKIMADILSFPGLEDSHIALVDIDPIRLQTAEKMAKNFIAKLGGKATLETTMNRRDVLKNADYVISMIKVGGYDAALLDFEIPKKYGLKQTIGDTCGVGGIFRGLRTMPVILDICRDIEELCPDALFLNYTNPMSMLCLAVFKAMPQVKMIGLCHSVQGTSKALASYIGVPYEDVSYWVAGINHMAWFLKFEYKGQDAYPMLFKAMNDPEVYKKDKVKFEIMKRTGYFVTESSTHMAEYLPYFMKSDDLIERFDIKVDQHLRNVERLTAEFEATKAKLDRGEDIELPPESHEYAARIIHAMETGDRFIFNGNVYNNGLITNLPSDSCVEVECIVDRTGVHPCYVGDLPLQLAALNRSNINVHQLAVEAVLTGKKDYVYQAVMVDPNASSVLSLDEIWQMTDELIAAHGNILPAFK